MEAEDPILGFPVVGIGASARGLEAVKKMASHARDDCGLALVLVQYLDPDHEGLMTELISRSTDLPVQQMRNGGLQKPDEVFVIPPGHALEVSAGHLCLKAFDAPRNLRRPIDNFFASLARSQDQNAAWYREGGSGYRGHAAQVFHSGDAAGRQRRTHTADGILFRGPESPCGGLYGCRSEADTRPRSEGRDRSVRDRTGR
ncbi:chemotaxis protein CheB [Jannaschia donghaensis]|uniref:protein-glutamate methylesterase n=1 Tax=Jannaschia donghaensis TaxID=420998 RepID=A0A0M6YDX7_9RHOB|nr:chemotaxis protein CheB [Jannaschia donghaensis]CTQ48551.1 chemotaxis-specific methylesterase [Jannaschia donghaensis]